MLSHQFRRNISSASPAGDLQAHAISFRISAWSAEDVIRYMYYANSNHLIAEKRTPELRISDTWYSSFVFEHFLSDFPVVLRTLGDAHKVDLIQDSCFLLVRWFSHIGLVRFSPTFFVFRILYLAFLTSWRTTHLLNC